MIIDESHVTIPQVRAMYAGDQARKKSLIDNGFRCLSALDNRQLQFCWSFSSAPTGDLRQLQRHPILKRVVPVRL